MFGVTWTPPAFPSQRLCLLCYAGDTTPEASEQLAWEEVLLIDILEVSVCHQSVGRCVTGRGGGGG